MTDAARENEFRRLHLNQWSEPVNRRDEPLECRGGPKHGEIIRVPPTNAIVMPRLRPPQGFAADTDDPAPHIETITYYPTRVRDRDGLVRWVLLYEDDHVLGNVPPTTRPGPFGLQAWQQSFVDTFYPRPRPQSDADDVAPDSIEPVLGWRVWRVVDADGPAIVSPVRSGHLWPPGRALTAECNGGRTMLFLTTAEPPPEPERGRIPHEGCTSCGIHAARNPLYALRQYGPRGAPAEVVVLGRVKLAGKVIPGSQGYRAERAYPGSFIALQAEPGDTPNERAFRDRQTWEAAEGYAEDALVEALAARYDVPVESWEEMLAESQLEPDPGLNHTAHVHVTFGLSSSQAVEAMKRAAAGMTRASKDLASVALTMNDVRSLLASSLKPPTSPHRMGVGFDVAGSWLQGIPVYELGELAGKARARPGPRRRVRGRLRKLKAYRREREAFRAVRRSTMYLVNQERVRAMQRAVLTNVSVV